MRFTMLGACALVASAVVASSASSQEDPYGSTTITTAPPRVATVRLTVDSGPPGTQVGVFACGYAPAAAPGSVSFDGRVVASGLVANADGCLTVDGSPGPAAAPLTIRVPDDARPGQRNLCSVLAGYNTPCEKFQVQNGNGGNGNGGNGNGGNGNGGNGNGGNGNGPSEEVLGATESRSSPQGALPRTESASGSPGIALKVVAGTLALAAAGLFEVLRRRRRSLAVEIP